MYSKIYVPVDNSDFSNRAIANAVAHATGARVYELPITPARVLAALAAKGGK